MNSFNELPEPVNELLNLFYALMLTGHQMALDARDGNIAPQGEKEEDVGE